jgi:hypothetical protein
MNNRWRKILSNFEIEGTPIEISRLGKGLINDTYKLRIVEPDLPDYVVQRINSDVFKDVDKMQRNIDRVTAHIREKMFDRGVPGGTDRLLTFVKSRTGKSYYEADGEFWRVSKYIDRSKSRDDVTPELAYITGKSFADFQYMLSDLGGEPLDETIPNFHNIEFRISQLREAVSDDKAGRLERMRPLVDELLERADEMSLAERLGREGKLTKRITHCDTKVNNILFDEDDNVLCVIDLDTTMPGYVLSDYGDFIRSAANTGAEDDKDLDNVGLDMEIFKAFTRGYLEGAKPFITDIEKELLPFGAKLLTYMQTVRFLTDYLNGDTYYKINYPEHNYDRTMAQKRLLDSLDAHEEEMKEYIASV